MLPVLQSIRMASQLSRLVEGWDCQYFSDLSQIRPSTNQESLGELLAEFFRVYAFAFDYKNSTVSVRTGRHLSKADKEWVRSRGRDRHYVSRHLHIVLSEFMFTKTDRVIVQ